MHCHSTNTRRAKSKTLGKGPVVASENLLPSIPSKPGGATVRLVFQTEHIGTGHIYDSTNEKTHIVGHRRAFQALWLPSHGPREKGLMAPTDRYACCTTQGSELSSLQSIPRLSRAGGGLSPRPDSYQRTRGVGGCFSTAQTQTVRLSVVTEWRLPQTMQRSSNVGGRLLVT